MLTNRRVFEGNNGGNKRLSVGNILVSEYISDNRKAEVWIKKILIRGHDTFMFEISG